MTVSHFPCPVSQHFTVVIWLSTAFITCLHFTHQIIVLYLISCTLKCSWLIMKQMRGFSCFWTAGWISWLMCYFFLRSYMGSFSHCLECSTRGCLFDIKWKRTFKGTSNLLARAAQYKKNDQNIYILKLSE